MSSAFHEILRAVASAMELPVVLLLVLLLAFAVFTVGWLLVEYFTEHRHMKFTLPVLLETLRTTDDVSKTLERSRLNRRQRALLAELAAHPELTAELRRSLADNLLEHEQAHYDRLIKLTDLAAKLAPMFGLLGTLIPLGPGIIALGQGDTYTLSVSLLTAFDTTIVGLIAAAFCMVVSTVRKRWYGAYMSDLETLSDCLCEREAAA